MNDLVIILLISLIGLIIIFIGLLAYFGSRFLRLKEDNVQIDKDSNPQIGLAQSNQISNDVLNSLRSNLKKEQEPVVQSVYCLDHPEIYANGKCAISLEPLCEQCLTKQDDILIGRKYLELYLSNEWNEIYMLKENKEQRDRLIKAKKALWENESLPVIIQGHYKINVQSDEIEQYTVIYSRPEDESRIRKEFSFLG